MGLDLCSDKGCMKNKYSAIGKEGNLSRELMLCLVVVLCCLFEYANHVNQLNHYQFLN
jgi:hypothetical protein